MTSKEHSTRKESYTRMFTYFMKGEGIDRRVITADICRYLGNDATVRPGFHGNQEGFYITAYRPPSSAQLADLRADSQKWREEKARNSAQPLADYEQSSTRQQSMNREDPRLQAESYKPVTYEHTSSSMTAPIRNRPAGSYSSARVGFPNPLLVPGYTSPASGIVDSGLDYKFAPPPSYPAKYNPPVSFDTPVPAGYGRGEPPSNYDYGWSRPSRFPFGTSEITDRTVGSGNSLRDTEQDFYDYDPEPGAASINSPAESQRKVGGRDRDRVNLRSQLLSNDSKKSPTENTSGTLTSTTLSGSSVEEISGQDREPRPKRVRRQGRDYQQTEELKGVMDNSDSTSKYIWDVTVNSAIADEHIFTIKCEVDWELPQYCKEELNSNMSLRHVLTITGSPEHAQAASCEDYVRQTWSEKGQKLLDAIITSIDENEIKVNIAYHEHIEIRSLSANTHSPGKIEIVTSGRLEDVVLTITLFAWFAATFRLPRVDGLIISKVNFQHDTEINYNKAALNGRFRLFLQAIEKPKLEKSSGPCWLPLFQEGVISYGFPIAKRGEGEGLEIPIELLRLLTRVKGSVEYEDDTVYVGPSRILFPTKVFDQGVQWHYVESDNKQVLVDTLSQYKNRVRLQDISNLETLRSFLGSYKHALVYAGTEEGIQSSHVSDSRAPKSSSRVELAKEFTLSGLAGIAAPGGSIGLGARLVLPRSLQVSLEGVRDYDNRLYSASMRPILVYDLGARSAWLVSELSMVLHMVHNYLSDEKLESRRQHSGDLMAWPSLPFARPSADGGGQAWRLIRDLGHLPLYTRREDGRPQELWNEIDNFLKVFGTIRTQDYIQRATSGWKLRKPRLQGWDFSDLATKEETVFQRELCSDNKRLSWWALAEVDDMVVLFGRDFGQLIRPDIAKTKPYKGWESIPGQAELLTASMPCVRWLAGKCNKTGNCEKLTSELFWHKPTSRSCTGNFSCTDGCLYVQELRSRGLFGMSQPNPPGKRLYANDAVIFGEIKYYHEAVRRERLFPD